MFYIYRITNLINGKTYIGQHEYKKLNEWYMGKGKRLRAAQKGNQNCKGKHWFTNGKVNKLSKTCPEGFYLGRTKSQNY